MQFFLRLKQFFLKISWIKLDQQIPLFDGFALRRFHGGNLNIGTC